MGGLVIGGRPNSTPALFVSFVSNHMLGVYFRLSVRTEHFWTFGLFWDQPPVLQTTSVRKPHHHIITANEQCPPPIETRTTKLRGCHSSRVATTELLGLIDAGTQQTLRMGSDKQPWVKIARKHPRPNYTPITH